MKLFSIILLSLLFQKGCTESEKQDLANAMLVYEATTRGFYEKIIIQNQMISVSKDRSGKDNAPLLKISDKNWKDLISDFDLINLDELSNMKAPTERRFYDGSAIASLKITYKEKTYQTSDFDHGFPPLEITKLVDKINLIADEQKE
jgi:hypothetical protein